MFRPALLAVWLMSGLVLLSCGDDDVTDPDPTGQAAELVRIGGHDQEGAVGDALGEALVVEARDAEGNPVAGVTVSWASDDGSFEPVESATDEAGRAEATWTLGTVAGEQTATASAADLEGVTFLATAAPGPAVELVVIGDAEREGTVGAALGEALVVEARDEFENAVPGVTVSWTGNGSFDPAESDTDADGRAQTTWTLGPDVGEQTADANSSELAPGRFTAMAEADTEAETVRVITVGDANTDFGWVGSDPPFVARSYISQDNASVPIPDPADPHHPTQLAGKIEEMWAANGHERPLRAVNHAIAGTTTKTGFHASGALNLRQTAHGVTRFEAEILGLTGSAGSVWDGNECGSGTTCGEGYPTPRPRVNAVVPDPNDFVYVSMGTTDIARPNPLTPREIRDNLAWMVDQWVGADLPAAHFIITTMSPAPAEFNDEIRTLNDLIRTMAAERGVTLVDLGLHTFNEAGDGWADPNMLVEDGTELHYGESVRDWLTEEIVAAIEELILAEP